MGSQSAPEPLGIIDAGDAPVIFIDGVALHTESKGIIRLALYADQPVIEPGALPSDPCKSIRVVVLKLLYTTETQALMRRQMVEHLGDTVRTADLPTMRN